MPIEPGQILLHYRIAEKLGEGGMGVVWKAVDTSLDREVAIKVLPDAVATDADRLARFEREAKLLATLNHPNIAGVYGLHECDSPDGTVRFIAMELVQGEDLDTRIARGALAIEDAVEIGHQIAAAVEAAHESGVIHRDLKPANVIVSPSNRIKVLDFGLAKAFSDEASGSGTSPSMSPTITSVGTVVGVILGTAAYMSPEQAKGRAVDRRADIWSFGALLYEALTGRRTFTGETVSETLASVLKDPVDWKALPASTPRAVTRLLQRCLDRDPNTRLRDIGEARIVLADPGDETTSHAAVAAESSPRRIWPVAAAGLLLGLAGLWIGSFLRPAPPLELLKLDITDDTLVADQLRAPRLSPDGSTLAYFAGGALRVRDLDDAEARVLPGTESSSRAFWSPDGTSIGFQKDDGLYRVSLDGAAPALIARPGSFVGGGGACWSDDDRIVFSRGNTALFEVPARGGNPRVLLEPDREKGENHFHTCFFLPDGRGLLYVVHPVDSPADTIALLADDGPRNVLRIPNETLNNISWSPTGHLVFGREGGSSNGVWAVAFDLDRLETTGDAFPLAQGGSVPNVSNNGSLVYAPGVAEESSRLVWVSRDGAIGDEAIEFDHPVIGFDLSPDGRFVAASVIVQGTASLWIADLERGTQTRITEGPGTIAAPHWSPDGKQIAFSRVNLVFVVDVGSGVEPLEIGGGLGPSFTQDGQSIVVHRPNSSTGEYDLWLLDADGGKEIPLIREETVSSRWGEVSPDGRYLAYERGSGVIPAVVTRFPEGTGRWQISRGAGGFLRWSPDGTMLFYTGYAEDDPDAQILYEVDFEGGSEVVLGAPRAVLPLTENDLTTHWALDEPRQRFLVRERRRDQLAKRLIVVRNWFEEFR